MFGERRTRMALVAGAAILATLAPSGAASALSTPPAGSVAVPEPAPNGAAGSDLLVRFTLAGTARSYRLFVPTKLPATGARLMVALHPFNGAAPTYESNSNLDISAGSTGTLVAYPSGVDNSWNAGTCCGYAERLGIDDVGFLDTVIDDVESRYSVDAHHIAIGGFSNGAMMSYRYVCTRSARVHTVFSGSGALMTPACSFQQPVQVLHFHGMKDTVVPWQGTTSSPYPSDGVMPSVSTTVGRLGAADGCTVQWTGSRVSDLANKYAPKGCPSGASLTVYQSQTLVHGWVTGPNAVPTYGLNETNLVWSWVLGVWSQT